MSYFKLESCIYNYVTIDEVFPLTLVLLFILGLPFPPGSSVKRILIPRPHMFETQFVRCRPHKFETQFVRYRPHKFETQFVRYRPQKFETQFVRYRPHKQGRRFRFYLGRQGIKKISPPPLLIFSPRIRPTIFFILINFTNIFFYRSRKIYAN